MKLNKSYYQISIDKHSWAGTPYDLLKGKVIDKVAFNNNSEYEDQHQLIITFTDKTYIAIGLEYDHDKDMYVLDDIPIMEPECVNEGRLDTHVNSEGKLVFDKNWQQLIDLGIYDVSIEEVEQKIAEHDKRQEEREYEQYLRLKAKFEKNG